MAGILVLAHSDGHWTPLLGMSGLGTPVFLAEIFLGLDILQSETLLA